MRLLLVSLALARWARAEDGDPTGNMCREYDHPKKGAWSVDEDCCAGESQAACEIGYHYVRSNKVCHEECDAYYYSCEKCTDDVECVGVGCENCDPHHDIYSDEHGGRPFNEEDVCRDNHGWFIWELLSAIFYCCLIASLTFGIMGLWNARRVLGTGQQLCGAPLSASTMYNANVYLSGCNLFMLIMNIIVVMVETEYNYVHNDRAVYHGVLGGVTAAAAVQLKQKKEHWNAPIGVQSYGQPAHGQPHSQPVMSQPVMGQLVVGQPVQGQYVMGTVITGQPVQGMPAQRMPVQPAMGGPVMVNGQPRKTY